VKQVTPHKRCAFSVSGSGSEKRAVRYDSTWHVYDLSRATLREIEHSALAV